MSSSWSSLVDNLAEVFHKIKRKDADCLFEYGGVHDNLTNNKCLSCCKSYSKKINENLKKRFKNTFKFF